MTKLGLAALVAFPIALAACQKAPPPPPPAPVQTAGEAACAARAAQVAGVDAATVLVTPTASTKTGATIYTASVNGADYRCVVELDNSISTFGALRAGE